MNFNPFAIYFKFTKQQRTGIFLLFALIIILQIIYFFVDFNLPEKAFPEKEEWMSLQTEIDSMKLAKFSEKPKVYSFNPNLLQIIKDIN